MVCLSWDGKLQLCFPSKMFLAVSLSLTHKKRLTTSVTYFLKDKSTFGLISRGAGGGEILRLHQALKAFLFRTQKRGQLECHQHNNNKVVNDFSSRR